MPSVCFVAVLCTVWEYNMAYTFSNLAHTHLVLWEIKPTHLVLNTNVPNHIQIDTYSVWGHSLTEGHRSQETGIVHTMYVVCRQQWFAHILVMEKTLRVDDDDKVAATIGIFPVVDCTLTTHKAGKPYNHVILSWGYNFVTCSWTNVLIQLSYCKYCSQTKHVSLGTVSSICTTHTHMGSAELSWHLGEATSAAVLNKHFGQNCWWPCHWPKHATSINEWQSVYNSYNMS